MVTLLLLNGNIVENVGMGINIMHNKYAVILMASLKTLNTTQNSALLWNDHAILYLDSGIHLLHYNVQ